MMRAVVREAGASEWVYKCNWTPILSALERAQWAAVWEVLRRMADVVTDPDKRKRLPWLTAWENEMAQARKYLFEDDEDEEEDA